MMTEERGRPRDRMGFAPPKHSRWDDHGSKTFVPGIPTFIPTLSKQELACLLLRIRIEEIGYKIANNQLDLQHFRKRSPSPAPVYDAMGHRSNTRETRAKQRLVNERHYLIEKATRLNPHFKPPADYRSMSTKRTRKIYIPIEQFPDYNFIGLIIGPRGLTQKQMEKESGAKIAIRGKGSVKEGKGKNASGDEDRLHVLITADTKKQITTAAKMVKKLLVPVEEGKNEHKRAQLRKLAEINGTLRDNVWQPTGRTWTSADVYCKHCGEISHPSSDCPLKGKKVAAEVINSEYDNFMSEIGISSNDAATANDTEKSYEEFMNSLNAATKPAATPQPLRPNPGPPFPGGPFPHLPPVVPPFAPMWAPPGGMPGFPGPGGFPPPGFHPPDLKFLHFII
eukprot:TRINITY_DN1358_c0_g2_i4.p1 TRINITY_DN1358_c0_g2~~TRINITY_DN1358_c0_g2_i4.p1  ORF type:complete len:395 (+),score=84.77 TRINITY_DN1358_c0_g2_i4:62-1246(+)